MSKLAEEEVAKDFSSECLFNDRLQVRSRRQKRIQCADEEVESACDNVCQRRIDGEDRILLVLPEPSAAARNFFAREVYESDTSLQLEST